MKTILQLTLTVFVLSAINAAAQTHLFWATEELVDGDGVPDFTQPPNDSGVAVSTGANWVIELWQTSLTEIPHLDDPSMQPSDFGTLVAGTQRAGAIAEDGAWFHDLGSYNEDSPAGLGLVGTSSVFTVVYAAASTNGSPRWGVMRVGGYHGTAVTTLPIIASDPPGQPTVTYMAGDYTEWLSGGEHGGYSPVHYAPRVAPRSGPTPTGPMRPPVFRTRWMRQEAMIPCWSTMEPIPTARRRCIP